MLDAVDPRGANVGVVVNASQTENLELVEAGEIRPIKSGAATREISGNFAFKLYDTYGFPLDLTELMARERGFTVDVSGFERLMEEQRARARASQDRKSVV